MKLSDILKENHQSFIKKLIDDFLESNKKDIGFYSIRDNCGPACLDMWAWVNKNNKTLPNKSPIVLKRVKGFFKADVVVSDKEDFTYEMKQEFKLTNKDFNKDSDRKSFIESNPKYKEEWKLIPHYWLVDQNNEIYDPTGNLQFIKTGLSKDLNKKRYIQK